MPDAARWIELKVWKSPGRRALLFLVAIALVQASIFAAGIAGERRAAHGRELAERILTALSRAIRVGDVDHEVGVSIGTAVFPSDGTDAQTLLRCADAALLRAKREGRRRQIFADDAIFSRTR